MTHMSAYSSSNESVAKVVGSRVFGRSAGSTVISANGGVVSSTVTIIVDDAVIRPQLVPRIVTEFSADGTPSQLFDDEGDVGYLYVYANYSNGDAHPVDAAELAVSVVADSLITYELVEGDRHRVGIMHDATAASSCSVSLLSVALAACNSSLEDAFEPPLELELPPPTANCSAEWMAHGIPAFTVASSSSLYVLDAVTGTPEWLHRPRGGVHGLVRHVPYYSFGTAPAESAPSYSEPNQTVATLISDPVLERTTTCGATGVPHVDKNQYDRGLAMYVKILSDRAWEKHVAIPACTCTNGMQCQSNLRNNPFRHIRYRVIGSASSASFTCNITSSSTSKTTPALSFAAAAAEPAAATSGAFETDTFVYGVYPACSVEIGKDFNVGIRFNAPVAPSNGFVGNIKDVQYRVYYDDSCLTYQSTSRCVHGGRAQRPQSCLAMQ
jgi:hypothetical protein